MTKRERKWASGSAASSRSSRARSSAGERSPHTREVAGSNPAAPMLKALLFKEILSDIAGNRAPVQALVPESRLLSPVAGDAGRFRAAAGGRGDGGGAGG